MRAKIYVPTPHPDDDVAVHNLKSYLCDEYGGVTVYGGSGEWKDDNGVIMKEPVKVVEVVGLPSSSHVQTDIEHLAKTEVKQRLDQSEVLVTFEREIEEVII